MEEPWNSDKYCQPPWLVDEKKILDSTTIHKIVETNSNSFREEDWALGYNSMKF